MDLSGIIFVLLALAWAVYLVPKALKHHDELAGTRSVDRFSNAMRVLARHEPADRGNERVVVAPPRVTERVLVPPTPQKQAPTDVGSTAAQRPRSSSAARREAARAAARRRRHVLLVLLVADVAVVTLAAVSVLPWWSVAVPVALTLAYLALCRRQVRRDNDAQWAPVRDAESTPRQAIRVDTAYGTAPAAGLPEQQYDVSAYEDTVQIPLSELDTVAVSAETTDGGSLWDPLPVTLPTYVHKARATRSVRTIDLNAPDTWTSGRDEDDTALVEQTEMVEASEETGDHGHEPWRAVGT